MVNRNEFPQESKPNLYQTLLDAFVSIQVAFIVQGQMLQLERTLFE